MPLELEGRVALVTGAGQGIGLAIARRIGLRGVSVAVNTLHPESADRACDELNGHGCTAISVPANVADDEAVVNMMDTVTERLGHVDILVNNAAAPAELRPLASSTLREQNNELVTLIGTLNCTRHACGQMVARRTGRIINISSVAGYHGMPLRAVYSAANAGIDAFTRAIAKELGPHGVTANAVSPGATESPRFRARSDEFRAITRNAIALDRFGEPEEIADAVVFLASKQANYINGAILHVDGGFGGYLPPKI